MRSAVHFDNLSRVTEKMHELDSNIQSPMLARPHASFQVATGTARCQGKQQQSHTDVREESSLLHEKNLLNLSEPTRSTDARDSLCI